MRGLLPPSSRALGGGPVWLVFVLLTRPRPFEPTWIPALLLLAPLALVPLVLEVVERAGAGPEAKLGPSRPGRMLRLAGGLQLPTALYGSRFHFAWVRGLDIAWMQAFHGAANAFGFGGAGVLGWWLMAGREDRRDA